jgi:hypothetical protein
MTWGSESPERFRSRDAVVTLPNVQFILQLPALIGVNAGMDYNLLRLNYKATRR